MSDNGQKRDPLAKLKDELPFHLGVHLCQHKGCTFYEYAGCDGVEGEPCIVEKEFLRLADQDPRGLQGGLLAGVQASQIIRWRRLHEFVMRNDDDTLVKKYPFVFNQLLQLENRILKNVEAVTKSAAKHERQSPEQIRQQVNEWSNQQRLKTGVRTLVARARENGYEAS